MTTLVDSNILIDVIGDDSVWYEWSSDRMAVARDSGPLVINDVIFAETSIRYANVALFEEALERLEITMTKIPHEALFRAGKAFVHYRASGGLRTGVLPDFFIGAHAAVANFPLLTRDPRRYRTYFPDVTLIGPD